MGNEAIARGAVEAGLNVLAEWAVDFAYYVEWSVNEKV
jgi:hypothetical protein